VRRWAERERSPACGHFCWRHIGVFCNIIHIHIHSTS
jgi:hypothetical protein